MGIKQTKQPDGCADKAKAEIVREFLNFKLGPNDI